MKTQKVICGLLMAALLTHSALAGFSDTGQHWAEKSIQRWSDAQVVTGSGNAFRPDASLTRGEMAAMLCRLLGWKTASNGTFSDLGQSWYTDAVRKAVAAGVLQGSGGKLRPEDSITRQEAAVMLCRAFGLSGGTGGKTFTDGDALAPWAKDAVDTLSARGFIGGVPGGGFAPGADISRASLTTILDHAVDGFYTKAGSFTGTGGSGITIVRAPGVTLQNMKIGDLIVAPGAEGSETLLSSVTVSGTTTVQTGAEGIVTAAAGTVLKNLRLEGVNAHFEALEGATLGSITVTGSGTQVRGLPQGTKVTVAAGAVSVQVNGVSAAPGGEMLAPKDETTGFDDLEIIIDIGGGGGGSGGGGGGGGGGGSGGGGGGGILPPKPTPTLPPKPTPTPPPKPTPTPDTDVKYDENGNIIIDFGDLVKGGNA